MVNLALTLKFVDNAVLVNTLILAPVQFSRLDKVVGLQSDLLPMIAPPHYIIMKHLSVYT